MTKKEALKSTINFPLPDLTIDKALIDADIIGSDVYSKLDTRAIDLCAAELLFVLLTSADIKEGDFSQTLPDRDTILKLYSFLVTKWDVTDLLAPKKPTVTGRSNLW